MKVSKTYNIVTELSARDGEYAETGFIYEDKEMTVEELISEINEDGYVEGNDYNFYTVDPEIDYETGDETYYGYHVEGTDEELAQLDELTK